MSSEPVKVHWVICPLCRKADVTGSRYCPHCWGAIVHPEVEISPEEEEAVKERRRAYLSWQKKKKIGYITLGALGALLFIFISLYYLTDTIYSPPADLSSNSQPGEWAMGGYNVAHIGTPDPDGPVPQGKLKWAFSTGGHVHSSPAIVDGRVFFGSQDHKFYALDAESGTEIWHYEAGSWVESSPAVVDGKVYFGSNDSYIYAMDAQNGSKVWAFKTQFPVTSSPSVAGDIVYMGADDYNIYALNKDTGKKIWIFDAGSPVKSSPVVSAGILFTGTGGNGFSYTLNAENGQRRLRYKSHYSVYGSPAIYNDNVIFVTSNGVVSVVEGKARTWLREHEITPLWYQMWIMGIPGVPEPPGQTGLLWSYRLPGPSSSAPVISRDTLYIGAENKLIAIDMLTHQELWEFETDGTLRSSPAVVSGQLFFGGDDGKIYALDATTGEELWNYDTGDRITASPSVADGVLYIGTESGTLYALE